ncbi:hypothetical protein HNY73_010031 [Argiope bruennichi]|uniref:Uncharacterized protein n=1 Tax=Argiope bruennichi TaxID=94029 RepID=A0A8T0F1I6_ARGBR|nr:hypothetical protein HNY73_010031 [Argiope bruennichi]
MSRKFLATEETLTYLKSLDDETVGSEPELAITPPDPNTVTDNKEVDDTHNIIADKKLLEEPSDDSKKDNVQLSNKLTSINDILQRFKCELCALPDDMDLINALELTLELKDDDDDMKNHIMNDESYYPNHCFLSKVLSNLVTPSLFLGNRKYFEEQTKFNDELPYCEDYFERTHIRKPCGRYSVSLSFKQNIEENVNLGDSRTSASKRLNQLWRRLTRENKLKVLYTKFIEEYLSLNHMEEVLKFDEIKSDDGFFLPHHGVLYGVLLRVVFKGSQKLILNISFNDVLCKGGTIQEDLFSIMLRARKHEGDASDPRRFLGFAAVVYVFVQAKNGNKNCHLLCSQIRVAPIKTLSIPLLELSAYLLRSKIVNKVVAALKTDLQEITLYSDSTIALSWIRFSPHLLKTFLANRVAKMQKLTKHFSWQHISSENNPADLLSRGLVKSEMWWKGADPSKLVHAEYSQNCTDDIKTEFKTSVPKLCCSQLKLIRFIRLFL